MSEPKPIFKRVLLKLSGEALMGRLEYGIDPQRVVAIASAVRGVVESGVQLAIVPGGGNIYRGLRGAAEGMDRATGDYMGMLATVLNALALQDALREAGRPHARAVGDHRSGGRRALHPPPRDAPPREGAGRDLRRRHGNPFFTTDTAAALRASEILAEAILMAKNGVEGVYSADPALDPTRRVHSRGSRTWRRSSAVWR